MFVEAQSLKVTTYVIFYCSGYFESYGRILPSLMFLGLKKLGAKFHFMFSRIISSID